MLIRKHICITEKQEQEKIIFVKEYSTTMISYSKVLKKFCVRAFQSGFQRNFLN